MKSRQKALEKLIASDDYVKQPPNLGKPFRFRFPPAPRMGASEEVVSVNGVSHGYNGRRLFNNVNLVVDKGERIAFLGPNGAGKSTLLRLLVGQESPQEGSCELGSGVVKQYFEQNQADVLDLSLTVIETLMKASSGEKYEDLRKLLGQFLFKGDAVEKSVAQLSGGEKARVSLCKMMLTPANLLVLDEPTNHLDIPAKEMLEEALQHYEGSVLVVSHDRYFVSQVRDSTICLDSTAVINARRSTLPHDVCMWLLSTGRLPASGVSYLLSCRWPKRFATSRTRNSFGMMGTTAISWSAMTTSWRRLNQDTSQGWPGSKRRKASTWKKSIDPRSLSAGGVGQVDGRTRG